MGRVMAQRSFLLGDWARGQLSDVPLGRERLFAINPAMNCRATIKSPSGTRPYRFQTRLIYLSNSGNRLSTPAFRYDFGSLFGFPIM
jgi:hypothetical protein